MERDAVQMVKRGLRVQTQLAGITGQQYLAVDFFDPAKYPPLPFQWTPKYTYVPSAPSLTGEIIANAQALSGEPQRGGRQDAGPESERARRQCGQEGERGAGRGAFVKGNVLRTRTDVRAHRPGPRRGADRPDAAQDRLRLPRRLDGLLADPGLKQTVDNVAAISARLRKLADDGDLDRMVKRIDDSAERLDALIGDNQYDVRVIVQDLRVTADNLRALSETIKRYPAGVLVGGPPEKVQLPGNSR